MHTFRLILVAVLTMIATGHVITNSGGDLHAAGKDSLSTLSGDWSVVANGFELILSIEQKAGESKIGGGFIVETQPGKRTIETRIVGSVDQKNKTIKFTRTDLNNTPIQQYEGKLSLSGTSRPRYMEGVFSHAGKGSFPWTAQRVELRKSSL